MLDPDRTRTSTPAPHGKLTGADRFLTREHVRAMIAGAGVPGALLFVLVFAAGELLHVPGMVFVAAGVLAYGRLWGGVLGFLGALFSVSMTFLVVRAVAGQALAVPPEGRPLLQRMLGQLSGRPVRTVALLRAVFWMSPWLNYALALSQVRYRHYLLGSAVGLLVPLCGMALLFDWMVRFL